MATITLNKGKPGPVAAPAASAAKAAVAAVTLTLEQQRAADAWARCQGQDKDYANLAKGLPALIMNSGLMQVLAFLHEKGGKDKQRHCELLRQHLCAWLCRRFPGEFKSSEFGLFMPALMKTPPRTFQLVTTEAFAWLRWVRQMAPAVCADNGEQ